MNKLLLSIVTATVLLVSACSTVEKAADVATTDSTATVGDDAPDTGGVGGAEGDSSDDAEARLGIAATRKLLTEPAKEALDAMSSGFAMSVKEEGCVAENLSENLERLEEFDDTDPEQIGLAIRLVRDCFGDTTIVDSMADDILAESPELTAKQADCLATTFLDDEDLLVEVILADSVGTPVSPAATRSFVEIFKSCDLVSVLTGAVMEEEGFDQASAECFVDGMLADDTLLVAILEETDPFESGDPEAMVSVLTLIADCGLGQGIAAQMFEGADVTDEQSTCIVRGLAADAELLGQLAASDEMEDDPAAIVGFLRVLRDCDLGSALADEMFSDSTLTDDEALCLIDELVDIDPAAWGADARSNERVWVQFRLDASKACGVELSELEGD